MNKFFCWIGWHKWERIVRNESNCHQKDAFIAFYFLAEILSGMLSTHWKCKHCGKEK